MRNLNKTLILNTNEVLSFNFESYPIVCLLATDKDILNLSAMIDKLLVAGCIHFMILGEIADAIEDDIDDIIIAADASSVTTAHCRWHDNETLKEVIYFFKNHTYFGNESCLFLAVIADNYGQRVKLRQILSAHGIITRELGNDSH